METVWQDLRYGVRMLLKTPGFTVIAIVSLALGIGANTALFSVVDALLLKMLPVKEPERLVLFRSVGPRGFSPGGYNGSSTTDPETGGRMMTSFAYQSFQRMRERQEINGALSEIFAFGGIGLTASANGRAEGVTGQAVSGNYYTGLGVQPLLGRTITDEDDAQTASPVAVLSHRYWRQRFGDDRSVIGKQLNLNNVPFTIIGVTSPGFEGAMNVGSTQDVTIPIACEPRIYMNGQPSQLTQNGAGVWWLRVMGRLKPGSTAETGRAQLETVFQQSVLEHRAARQAQALTTGGNAIGDLDSKLYPKLYLDPGGQGEMGARRQYAPSLYMLLGVVVLVLLIACANTANLLLARAAGRATEIGVRLALGASRVRLARQLLTESLLLACLGGLAGMIFAFWLKESLLAVSDWGGRSLRTLEPQLDWRVLSFTMALSLLTGVVFGLAPAWRATKVDITPTLKDGGRGSSGASRSRLSRGLVILQVAMSFILLVGAGLFLRSLVNLQRVELGFNPRNLLLFGVNPGSIGYQGEKVAQLYQQFSKRLEAVPGVQKVTFSTNSLLSNGSTSRGVYLRDALTATPDAEGRIKSSGEGYVNHVRENFLETMEIPLLAGRALQRQDDASAPKVVVVNQAFANQYFPHENPIGKRFTFEIKRPDEIEIVGLVRDAKYESQRAEVHPTAYIPWRQDLRSIASATVGVRTMGDPTAITTAVRQAMRDVEVNLPLNNLRTQAEQAEQTLAMERLLAKLAGLFGVLAQILAAIGLFGVLSYAVEQRSREIGVRIALGADGSAVLRLIMGQGMTLAVSGVALGLLSSYGLTKYLESRINLSQMLFDVRLSDPLMYIGGATLLTLVALLACFIPARRATKVDPMVALRAD